MAVDVGPIIALISQRIVAAPSQVETPNPVGAASIIKRYREGLITDAGFSAEMSAQGYATPQIGRYLGQANFEREFDNFSDRLAILKDSYLKEKITYDQAKLQILQLIPDQAKAQLTMDLLQLQKEPAPARISAPPDLTVSQLTSAFLAGPGVLTEAAYRAELAKRRYDPAEIDLIVALEKTKLPKPAPAQVKQLSLSDLKALLSLGKISAQEMTAELIARQYSPTNAERLVSIELAKAAARREVTPRELSLAQLFAALDAGVITESQLRTDLAERRYAPEDIELLIATHTAQTPKPPEAERKLLSLAQLNTLLALESLTPQEYVTELIGRGYIPEDASRLLRAQLVRLQSQAPQS